MQASTAGCRASSGAELMFAFREVVVIARPPQEVFRVLTRFEDIPKFVPQVASAEQTSPGEVSVGTTFVQRGRLLGRTIETPTVVTVHEPHSRFAYRADEGPLPYEAAYWFRPSDGGTLLEADVTGRPKGPARAFEPALKRLMQRVYSRNLERLKVLVEEGD